MPTFDQHRPDLRLADEMAYRSEQKASELLKELIAASDALSSSSPGRAEFKLAMTRVGSAWRNAREYLGLTAKLN